MRPEDAVAYGEALLGAADRASQVGRKLWRWLGTQLPQYWRYCASNVDLTLAEKIEILQAVGCWYIFWSKKGHPIVAWY